MSGDGARVGRVLLVHELPGGFGGAERYLELLAGGLRRDGVQVSVLVFVRGGAHASPVADRLARQGIPVTVRPHRARLGAIRREVRRRRPQVLHWTFVDPHAFQGAALLLWPWPVPSVITEHLPMLGAGWHRRFTRDLANRRIAVAIAVGRSGAEEVRRAWRHPPRTVVIPNGVPLADEAARRPPSPAHDPARLLFVGRLTDQKGVLELPEIVAALVSRGRSVRLRVLGDGPLRDELEGRGDRVAPGSIEVLGFDDPAAELAAADVLLVPSHWEGGFPLSAREALAASVPVVVSDIAPHHDLGSEHAGVRVVPTRAPEQWAEAVDGLLAALPAAGGEAARLAAEWSVEQMVERTRDVYDQVVAAAEEPPGA